MCKSATLQNIKIEEFMDFEVIKRNTQGVTVRRSRANLDIDYDIKVIPKLTI
jgi:hypothetical protein